MKLYNQPIIMYSTHEMKLHTHNIVIKDIIYIGNIDMSILN
jgi:hypothetical protein